jgi:alpha-D-ribose 1-methylphosphonate 5-phosphate C-P lyase
LHLAEALFLFGAGREKRIYAVPPWTRVEPLAFEDHPFRVEDFGGRTCARCGAADTYLDELIDDATGARSWNCADTAHCGRRREGGAR